MLYSHCLKRCMALLRQLTFPQLSPNTLTQTHTYKQTQLSVPDWQGSKVKGQLSIESSEGGGSEGVLLCRFRDLDWQGEAWLLSRSHMAAGVVLLEC